MTVNVSDYRTVPIEQATEGMAVVGVVLDGKLMAFGLRRDVPADGTVRILRATPWHTGRGWFRIAFTDYVEYEYENGTMVAIADNLNALLAELDALGVS